MSDFVAELQAAVHRVLAQLGAELEPLDLTHAECNALHQLGEPQTVRALQHATGQRPSTLTSVLDRLERRGLVRRELTPDDRRSFTVALTEPGEAVAAEVDRAFAAVDAAIAEAVGAKDLAACRRVLAATVR